MRIPEFYISMYKALPTPVPSCLESLRTDGIALDPRVHTVEWSSALPGGWNGCKIDIRPQFNTEIAHDWASPYAQRSLLSEPKGHITITTGQGASCFEGRRTKPTYTHGRLTGIEGAGYGIVQTSDAAIYAPPTIFTTGQGALHYALLTALPPFNIGDTHQFQDTGVAHELTEYLGQTPLQVVDMLTKEGGRANVLFDFAVWENRTAYFLPREKPTTPDYQLSWDNSVTHSEDDNQLYSTVVVDYTDIKGGAQQAVATDYAFIAKYGYDVIKHIAGGIMSKVGANQFAKTWITLHAQPWTQITIKRDPERGMPIMAGGTERPSYLVRAGEWVQFGDDPNDMYIIVRQTYNASGVSLEVGQPEAGWPQMLDTILATAAHVVRGTNPNTGGYNVNFSGIK